MKKSVTKDRESRLALAAAAAVEAYELASTQLQKACTNLVVAQAKHREADRALLKAVRALKAEQAEQLGPVTKFLGSKSPHLWRRPRRVTCVALPPIGADKRTARQEAGL